MTLFLIVESKPVVSAPNAPIAPSRYYPLPPTNGTGSSRRTPAKIYGVNLGGWLLLEPWITPSLFDDISDPAVKDEWTFCEFLGATECSARLEKHWSSFFTLQDVQVGRRTAGLRGAWD